MEEKKVSPLFTRRKAIGYTKEHPIYVDVHNVSDKNRHQRRMEAKLAKRNDLKDRNKYNVSHWVQRFVREMQGNKQVENRVLGGHLDKYLD